VEDLLKQMIGSQRGAYLAREAYNTIAQAFDAGRVPTLLPLSRVITNLRRPADEAAVRHLYDIAQVAIASFTGTATARAIAWRWVEDAMIVACCHLGRLEQAGAHRARIIEAGMTPSPDAYATMIASSKDTTDDALVAREMFDESQRLGVKPNLYLYNTIISKLSKARKVELALELFAHMKATGIRPSSVTYGAVMVRLLRWPEGVVADP
jgi:pentatricopeptide repeat protein